MTRPKVRLATLPGAEVTHALVKALRGTNDRMPFFAVGMALLRRHDLDDVTPAVLALFRGDHWGKRSWALSAFELLPALQVTAALVKLAHDRTDELRWRTVDALKGRQGPEATAALVELALDPEHPSWSRERTIAALDE